MDFGGQLEASVSAVRIRRPTRFTWVGQWSAPPPAALERAMTSSDRRQYLVDALASRLYRDFYASGTVRPASADGQGMARPDPAFLAGLIEANRGTGPWEGGWRVVGHDRAGIRVEQKGLTLLAPSDACRPVRSDEAFALGTGVELHLPNAFLGSSLGQYTALGNLSLPGPGHDARTRVYWHLTPEGAEPFIRFGTERLNEERIPFRLKVLHHPKSFDRCDAGVLYLPQRHLAAARPSLLEMLDALRPNLLDGVPALTKPAATGVAFADDPPAGRSFGMHRCRLIAEGMMRAHETGHRSLGDRLETVLSVFREADLDPLRPYLNPRSSSRFEALER
jgi:hypothetical protein